MGATFGVHVNATEAYPEAKNFDEKLVDKTKPGWNWLGQSYYIDQRRDINSGDLAKRFQQLRDETDPNLSLLYIDVYYTHGWIADKTLRSVQKQGWNVATEWADKFERGSLWSHWANDLDYGGATNKGLNSKIIRFIRNGEKDVWNNDPVLGQAAIDEFEGWTGETDWNAFYDNIWQRNLPAKYLQQQQITRWDGNDVTLTGGVRGTVENGTRTFYDHGRKVLSGTDYLLPWDGGKKLYHYSKSGGTSSWAVPSNGTYTVYALTDNGRVKTGTVKPVDGKITLTAEAGQPYVLYPKHAPKAADPAGARAPRSTTRASTTGGSPPGPRPARSPATPTARAATAPSSPAAAPPRSPSASTASPPASATPPPRSSRSSPGRPGTRRSRSAGSPSPWTAPPSRTRSPLPTGTAPTSSAPR